MQAMPAEPAPLQTSFVVFMSRPVTSSALMRPAADGDVHQFAQALLDDEALRRLDVLEVDAAEGGAEIAHAVDEGVGVFGVDLEVDGIDVGEALEQHRLAFHDRLRRQCAEIAEAEDGGAVGDDGDHVAAAGVVEGARGVFGDRLHRHRDARRIGQRQVALRRHRLGRHHFELARTPHGVKFQRLRGADGGAVAVGLFRHGGFLGYRCALAAQIFVERFRLRLRLPDVKRQADELAKIRKCFLNNSASLRRRWPC
jgi:hypothetical protein